VIQTSNICLMKCGLQPIELLLKDFSYQVSWIWVLNFHDTTKHIKHDTKHLIMIFTLGI
jgi:hypothetical protein